MSTKTESFVNEARDVQSVKTKCISIHKITLSHLFNNDKDEEQFRSIFEAIASSKAIRTNRIINDIVREIACYATGIITHCENKQCQQEIHVLQNDSQIYNDNHDNADKVGFKYYSARVK